MFTDFLTPLTLWQDFDDTLALNESIIKELKHDSITYTDIYFSGRAAQDGRVRIYAQLAKPDSSQDLPYILIIPDFNKTVDMQLAAQYAKKGYNVLTIDYAGENAKSELSTNYPKSIEYANLNKAQRYKDFVDITAKETSWYEWAAVGKYAIKYLKEIQNAKKIGILGIRHGADIMWQLAANNKNITCAAALFGCGWSAYRGVYKYDSQPEPELTTERCKYLAAVDAHAYAPYVNCPIMLLTATNDRVFDADRAFDTLARVNASIDVYGNFSVMHDGHLSSDCNNSLNIFFQKYLQEQAYVLPSPSKLSIDLEKGEYVINLKIADSKDVLNYEVYYCDGTVSPALRTWILASEKPLQNAPQDKKRFATQIYKESEYVFAFAKITYKNSFTISTNIEAAKVEKTASNLFPKSRVIYSSSERPSGFINLTQSLFQTESDAIAVVVGPYDIKGIYSKTGLKTYKIGAPRFLAQEESSLKIDAYSKTYNLLKITIWSGGQETGQFSCECELLGGENWQNIVLDSKDFKTVTGTSLKSFNLAQILVIQGGTDFVLNNIIWL